MKLAISSISAIESFKSSLIVLNKRILSQVFKITDDSLSSSSSSSSISFLELQLLTITSWQGAPIDKGVPIDKEVLEDEIRVDCWWSDQDDDIVDDDTKDDDIVDDDTKDDDESNDEEAMSDEVIDVDSQEMLK